MYAKFSVRRDTVHEPLRGVSIRSFVLSVGFYRNPRFAGASESPGDEKGKPGSAATACILLRLARRSNAQRSASRWQCRRAATRNLSA
jgi:hypothetical protein